MKHKFQVVVVVVVECVMYVCCVQRLHRGVDGTLVPHGFTESSDASSEDISLWLPGPADHRTLNTDVATYLVKLVSDEFCRIVLEEQQAVLWIKLDSTFFHIVLVLYCVNLSILMLYKYISGLDVTGRIKVMKVVNFAAT